MKNLNVYFYKYYNLFSNKKLKKSRENTYNLSFKNYICPDCGQEFFLKDNKKNLKKICGKCRKSKIIEKE